MIVPRSSNPNRPVLVRFYPYGAVDVSYHDHRGQQTQTFGPLLASMLDDDSFVDFLRMAASDNPADTLAELQRGAAEDGDDGE